jgi:hypothetical protein
MTEKIVPGDLVRLSKMSPHDTLVIQDKIHGRYSNLPGDELIFLVISMMQIEIKFSFLRPTKYFVAGHGRIGWINNVLMKIEKWEHAT